MPGVPDITEQLKRGGVTAIGREYKVHLDGYNIMPLLTGETDKSPREEIFHFSDTGDLTAVRYNDWKITFPEQEELGTLRVWAEPWAVLRAPMIFNLRRDPYERAYFTSNSHYDWMLDRLFFFGAAQAYVAQMLESYKEFPPRQKAGSFGIDQVMEKLKTSAGAN